MSSPTENTDASSSSILQNQATSTQRHLHNQLQNLLASSLSSTNVTSPSSLPSSSLSQTTLYAKRKSDCRSPRSSPGYELSDTESPKAKKKLTLQHSSGNDADGSGLREQTYPSNTDNLRGHLTHENSASSDDDEHTWRVKAKKRSALQHSSGNGADEHLHQEESTCNNNITSWVQSFLSFTPRERLDSLNQLLSVCHITEARHLYSIIEPAFKCDFISHLPKELSLHILCYLEPADVLKAAGVCQKWRILCNDNLLWREKCQEQEIFTSPSHVHSSMLSLSASPSSMSSMSHPSPWKMAYLSQMRIERNWRENDISSPLELRGHDDHVITCLEYYGDKIVSGSDDNTLKVWSAITGKCLRTLVGHTGGVWSSQMRENIIISGSTDRTLRIWNAETGKEQHVLYGHSSTVRCLHLHGDKVVSGSRDASLRVWDIHSGTCLHVLVGHMAAVRCVQYDGKRVVSGAYDYMVKVWDAEKETCLHTLAGHTNRVYSLQFDGSHIVSGSLDTTIRVWDVDTGQCVHTLMGHQSLTSGMQLLDNILVSGNADSTVKVWNIHTGECLQTLQGSNKHQSAVTCIQFSKKFVVTSSDDGTVKLWDVRSGEFIRNLVTLPSGGSGGVVWRIKASPVKLVCAVGSRNGTEETKLLVLDFDD